jgi:hypothetical protein
MRMREYAFSTAAWEKLVYERSTGDGTLQVLPAGSVTPQVLREWLRNLPAQSRGTRALVGGAGVRRCVDTTPP